jgi:hypothetical protein
MVTVRMPRADWDTVIYILEDMRNQGWLVGPLVSDIIKQVDKQEN